MTDLRPMDLLASGANLGVTMRWTQAIALGAAARMIAPGVGSVASS